MKAGAEASPQLRTNVKVAKAWKVKSKPRHHTSALTGRGNDERFDIDLAKSRSEDNPVYYVQYAHARICSVLNQWGGDAGALKAVDLSALSSKYESDLLRALADFPELLRTAARELAPHLVCVYLSDLAAKLHSYYNAEKFLVDDENLKRARLSLILATRQVLKNGLAVVGVSAPEKM